MAILSNRSHANVAFAIEIFLCHAQLYIFAEEKAITTLKKLALENLHDTLKNFTLHKERTGDIVSLLRCVYENTGPPADGQEEPLRKLMSDYLAFEMDTLVEGERFIALLVEEGGSLMKDFAAKIKERI